MPTPFPGMDPYFEDSEIWPGFHHALADELKAQLNPLIGPKYYAEVELRTVTDEVSIATAHTTYPDVGLFKPKTEADLVAAPVMIPEAPIQRTILIQNRTKLRSVRIYVTQTSQLVTSIEILSPINKRRGEGIDAYRRKRARLLQASVHLIELDLLRGGQRPGPEVSEPPLDTDYVLLVNRDNDSDLRISEIWPVALNEALPLLPVPLLPNDADVVLDLNAALRVIYPRAGYEWRIDYRQPVPRPNLRPAMAAWLREHLPNVAPMSLS